MCFRWYRQAPAKITGFGAPRGTVSLGALLRCCVGGTGFGGVSRTKCRGLFGSGAQQPKAADETVGAQPANLAATCPQLDAYQECLAFRPQGI